MAAVPGMINDWLGIRVTLYGILSECFLGKPRTQLKILDMYNRIGKLHETVHSDGLQIHGLLEELKKSLEDVNLYSLVIRDWRRLLQPEGSAYLCPFESVYSAQYKFRSKRLSGQRAEQELEFFYRHAGIDMKGLYTETADHAGVELAFMEGLITKEIQSRKHGHMPLAHCYTRWQTQFLDNHPIQWFGELSRQMEAQASTEFCRVLAKVAWHFLRTDYEILSKDS